MEAVVLRGALQDGVDVADVDDGLEGRRAAAGGGERLTALLGGRRGPVLLPDQRATQVLPLPPSPLLPAARHHHDRPGKFGSRLILGEVGRGRSSEAERWLRLGF